MPEQGKSLHLHNALEREEDLCVALECRKLIQMKCVQNLILRSIVVLTASPIPGRRTNLVQLRHLGIGACSALICANRKSVSDQENWMFSSFPHLITPGKGTVLGSFCSSCDGWETQKVLDSEMTEIRAKLISR